MKLRHVFSIVGGLFGICSMMYSLPQTIEAVDQAKAGGAPLGAALPKGADGLSGLAGLSGLVSKMSQPPQSIDSLRAGAKPISTEGAQIFSADGGELTQEQRRELEEMTAEMNEKLQAQEDKGAQKSGYKPLKKSRTAPKVTVHKGDEKTAEAK